MQRALSIALLLTACAGDFSVQLDESSEGSGTASTWDSMADTSSSDGGPSESSSDTTTSPDSSGTESSDPDTTSSESSSSSTGTCDAIEECVPCGDFENPDAACAESFPERPVCDVDSGLCVQCSADNASACSDTTPVCSAGECIGCSFHDQCPDTACDISTGACFDDACVREVDGDGGETYSALAPALADGCVVVLHERNGDVPYTESVDLDGIKIAILSADGEDPQIQGVGGSPTVHVGVGSTAYLVGMRLRGNTGAEGLSIEDGVAYLDDSQIVQNAGGGVVGTGGELHARNSFVGGNGGNGFSPTTGLSLDDVDVDLSYVTVAFNEGDGADSFQCTATTGTLRNSIVLGSDPASFDCPGVSADHTAFDDVIAGSGNEDVSPASGAWFVNPVSDFHVTVSGSTIFSAIAEWTTGDPAADIDGTDARPNSDGAPDVAGADVLP